ncbi:probable LRR receptor-like serine/threonine-protein kinase At1g34110 [Chenopodium quinoa]|uniref:Protein kinase domain-containing protein n=1 Tax=Chenopodium quinoa TaxID=63459 RepID=A0A803LR13_CHEQI|nr:probable LRR receptor-like serine/threonine-protein kinase At1g34110 [Chenopodium quinoa]
MVKPFKLNIFFLINFFILLLYSSFFQSILAETELTALMDIKSSLDPDNKILKTWLNDGDPCTGSFVGVACNDHRKIANISLQGRGLTGKLSPAIGELKSLSGLYLHYNSISGEIPAEVGELTELTDLYLNVNNFTGIIPPEISHMTNLQVLDLCCNRLTGNIPAQLDSLSKLGSLSLQYNQLDGSIPPSLGSLHVLKRLDLSYNFLSGPIPATIANIQQLHILDVRNNSLSGAIPASLKRLDTGFLYGNNTKLCGAGFLSLRACTALDNSNVDFNSPRPFDLIFKNHTTPKHDEPKNASFQTKCSSTNCSKSTKFPQIVIVVGVITASVTIAVAGFLTFFRYRRQKQKIGTMVEASESRFSTDHAIDLQSKSASPLVSLAYSTGWDPLADGLNSGDLSQEALQSFRFNLEEVESATQYFSEANMLGRGNFSTVYKGVLRDGSVVAVKSISVNSCQSEEAEFVKGLNLLVSLRHENLVSLRGFCCSRGRGECFFIYDFAPKGNLLKYLDVNEGSDLVLEWSIRVNIINGIAKGLCYLHEKNDNKPSVVHQNMSAEKIVIDNQYNPLILDSGLRKILADDTIFSALKVSAAMGYLAPEYITTGRFTEKSDVYAFGVLVLHILSGKQQLTNAMRSAAESSKLEDFVDQNLNGKFSVTEASKLVRLALNCTHELPDERPYMEAVIQELNKRNSGS